jgi:hypothetical protein
MALFTELPRRGLLGNLSGRATQKPPVNKPGASKDIRFFYLTRRFQSPPEPPQLGVHFRGSFQLF